MLSPWHMKTHEEMHEANLQHQQMPSLRHMILTNQILTNCCWFCITGQRNNVLSALFRIHYLRHPWLAGVVVTDRGQSVCHPSHPESMGILLSYSLDFFSMRKYNFHPIFRMLHNIPSPKIHFLFILNAPTMMNMLLHYIVFMKIQWKLSS